MIYMHRVLAQLDTPELGDTLKREIAALGLQQLPLQQALRNSSYASDDGLSVTIISISRGPMQLAVRAGIFFTGFIAGCNCADDPTPADGVTEYCEVLITIDRQTAATEISLVNDS